MIPSKDESIEENRLMILLLSGIVIKDRYRIFYQEDIGYIKKIEIRR